MTVTLHRPRPAKTTPTLHRMSETEFWRAFGEDDRVEWVDGSVIVMSPVSIRHVSIVGFLNTVLGIYARQREQGVVLGPGFAIWFGAPPRIRVPDLLFVTAARHEIITGQYVDGVPDLAIEVVAPDSLARDWREKYHEYEAAGLREYWVIDPMAARMEAYSLDAQGRYRLLPEEDGAIITPAFGVALRPAWLWQEPLPDPLEVLRGWGVM
jgi:Uma2 family endonuclease